jgi:hypothetical protein
MSNSFVALGRNQTMKRKIEIIAFEHERIIRRTGPAAACPICGSTADLLTTAQAGMIAKVNMISIRRWLDAGLAHGVKTVGGHHRVCRDSLFSLVKIKHARVTEKE